jgi:hypothetical protein
LKLIRDGDRDMDGTREELAELIEDIYNQENITNKVNVLQQEVESLQHQKPVLEEVLYVETIGENFKLIIQTRSMKEEVDRKTLEQKHGSS